MRYGPWTTSCLRLKKKSNPDYNISQPAEGEDEDGYQVVKRYKVTGKI